MEVIKLSMSKELFGKLFRAGHIKSGDYEMHKIDEPDFDYSNDEQWKQAKSQSIKAYKKLKEIEFNLRHESNK